MVLTPITLKEARRFVGLHHRHNLPSKGWRFGVAVRNESGELLGVGMAGQPIARLLDDGYTLEITRVCTNGYRNANSKLYGSLIRAAKALGYHSVITYTLQSESGASLRAVGFVPEAELEPHSGWDRPGRRRTDTNLFGEPMTPFAEPKIRWRCNLVPPQTPVTQGEQT